MRDSPHGAEGFLQGIRDGHPRESGVDYIAAHVNPVNKVTWVLLRQRLQRRYAVRPGANLDTAKPPASRPWVLMREFFLALTAKRSLSRACICRMGIEIENLIQPDGGMPRRSAHGIRRLDLQTDLAGKFGQVFARRGQIADDPTGIGRDPGIGLLAGDGFNAQPEQAAPFLVPELFVTLQKLA